MEQNMIWLSTSLFCNSTHWNCLFNQGIKPFIERTKVTGELGAYLLEANFLEGENIRLAMLTNKELANEVAQKADEHFRQFFSTADLPAEADELSHNSLFKPVPPNSIRYGLYTLDEIVNGRVAAFLSALLLETFSAENVDDEIIFSLGLYLHCGWIKALLEKKYLSPDQVVKSYTCNAGAEESAFAASLFDESKPLLLEMANDMAAGPLNGEYTGPYWLKTWIAFCTAEAEKALQAGVNQQENIKQLHFHIQFLVNKHLGVTKDSLVVLFHFISNLVPVFANRFVTVE